MLKVYLILRFLFIDLRNILLFTLRNTLSSTWHLFLLFRQWIRVMYCALIYGYCKNGNYGYSASRFSPIFLYMFLVWRVSTWLIYIYRFWIYFKYLFWSSLYLDTPILDYTIRRPLHGVVLNLSCKHHLLEPGIFVALLSQDLTSAYIMEGWIMNKRRGQCWLFRVLLWFECALLKSYEFWLLCR